jgi:adenylate cyclase
MIESCIRALRLGAGLVLFAYVAAHLANHAAMLISLRAADTAVLPIFAVVRSLPGTVLLYGAMEVHAILGLRAVAMRESWRAIRPGEVVQLLLGLAIVPLMAGHVMFVRAGSELFGFLPLHTAYVANLALRPEIALDLARGLCVVWLHGCIGVHYWLRLKPFFARWGAALAACAALLPVLALIGLLSGLREAQLLLAEPGFRDGFADEYRVPRGADYAALQTATEWIDRAWWFAVALVGAVSLLRGWRKRRREGIAVGYPDGRTVRAAAGLSLLGASRANGVPHASVCGGRGRCSTCRVRIVAGAAALTPADAAERKVLARVGADPDGAEGTAIVRLACQARLTGEGPVSMVPLLPAHAGPATARAGANATLLSCLRIFAASRDCRPGNCPTTRCSCSTAISPRWAAPSKARAAPSTNSSATGSWRCSARTEGARPAPRARRYRPRAPWAKRSRRSTPNSRTISKHPCASASACMPAPRSWARWATGAPCT